VAVRLLHWPREGVGELLAEVQETKYLIPREENTK
jgi:hypothetical protein